jgi:serine/threonine protein kinase
MTLALKESTPCRIGKYRIVCHLKSGGMGSVYKAEDPETGRLVALKVLCWDLLTQPKRLERFRREARQGARLRHEHLVTMYESGEDQGNFYIALEFVQGVDVEDLLNRHGPLSVDDARTIVTQVARALDYTHRLGVVHRDIKPANILITERQGRCIAKVGDLGLARGGLEDESRVTTDGTTVGTVDYMPPEQAADSGRADARSDLYSLGCTMYHMLSGAPPFAEGSIVERLSKHATAEPADLRQLNPRVPDELWAICKRLLAKRPVERYQTAADLLVDLVHAAPLADRAEPLTKHIRERVLGASAAPAQVGRATLDSHGKHTTASSDVHRIADGQFEYAARIIATGDLDCGTALLLNCCRLDPGNLAFHQALRQAQLTRRDTPGQRPWLSLPKRWALRCWLLAAQKLHRPLRVLQCAEQLLVCDPGDVASQLAMAEAAEAAGFTDLVRWLLETAHAAKPEHAGIARTLAYLLEEQGELQRAIDLWEEIAAADASDCEAHKKYRDLAAQLLTGRYRASRKSRQSTRGHASVATRGPRR